MNTLRDRKLTVREVDNRLGLRSTTRREPLVIPGHIRALDGLRAFAILAVMFHHYGEYYLLPLISPGSRLGVLIAAGGSGVDLFFVLSGFLITGILLDTRKRSDYFPRFYWRRALRIWPLYYVFLFLLLLFHGHSFRSIGFAPYALYYRNFLGPDPASDTYVGQFWSLCVEEQFYLVWPLILLFCPKRFRMPGIVGLFLAALLLRSYLTGHGVDLFVVVRLTYCRMDDLVAGAAIAVLIRNGENQRALHRLCWIAVAVGGASVLFLGYGSHYVTLGLTSFAIFYGGIVGLCARATGKRAVTFLGSPMLRAISTRSYAMYVFHLVPLYATYKLILHLKLFPLGAIPSLLVMLTTGMITYGLAWVSWRYLEEPILRLKDWEWYSRKRLRTANED
jgi:peptidoglycan/LPS O-acetylase OafA/YrhL